MKGSSSDRARGRTLWKRISQPGTRTGRITQCSRVDSSNRQTICDGRRRDFLATRMRWKPQSSHAYTLPTRVPNGRVSYAEGKPLRRAQLRWRLERPLKDQPAGSAKLEDGRLQHPVRDRREPVFPFPFQDSSKCPVLGLGGGFVFLMQGRRCMVFDEFSVRWTRSRSLFDGPRMRYQHIRICERGSHVACTTGTSAASGT